MGQPRLNLSPCLTHGFSLSVNGSDMLISKSARQEEKIGECISRKWHLGHQFDLTTTLSEM